MCKNIARSALSVRKKRGPEIIKQGCIVGFLKEIIIFECLLVISYPHIREIHLVVSKTCIDQTWIVIILPPDGIKNDRRRGIVIQLFVTWGKLIRKS